MTHYKYDDMTRNEEKRMICPECKDHPQGEPSEMYDCKNTYDTPMGWEGQCNCYSEAHGKRR